jgi:hypothetical protein
MYIVRRSGTGTKFLLTLGSYVFYIIHKFFTLEFVIMFFVIRLLIFDNKILAPLLILYPPIP